MARMAAVGRVEFIADWWFRAWGTAALLSLTVTAGALLAGFEGWRLPFVLAHLAALLALVPLGLVILSRVVGGEYARRGSVAGAVRGVFAHDRIASVLVVVALVAIAVSLSQFQDGIRWLRALANYTTVSIILVLVARYLRTR